MLRKGVGSEGTKANLRRMQGKQRDTSRGAALTAKNLNSNYVASRAAALPPMVRLVVEAILLLAVLIGLQHAVLIGLQHFGLHSIIFVKIEIVDLDSVYHGKREDLMTSEPLNLHPMPATGHLIMPVEHATWRAVRPYVGIRKTLQDRQMEVH